MIPSADARSTLIDDRISSFLREAHLSRLDAADLRAGSRTLILECRDGWAAEEAWRRVGPGRSQVIGVDVSDRMIELAKRYREVPDRLEFRTWNQRTLPFGDDSFDTVISTFSLHRYDDPERVLSEARAGSHRAEGQGTRPRAAEVQLRRTLRGCGLVLPSRRPRPRTVLQARPTHGHAEADGF